MKNRDYKKVTRATIRKRIKETGKFDGFAVGNKVNESNFFENWCLAMNVSFNNLSEFETKDNAMNYYLDKELGSNIAWYEWI